MSERIPAEETAVILNREGMGSADPELSRILIDKWLQIMEENRALPGALLFYADGVKLVTEVSPVLETLRRWESAGVRLIVCKTCLDFHGIADRVAVGLVGGMGDIVAAQLTARKVITL